MLDPMVGDISEVNSACRYTQLEHEWARLRRSFLERHNRQDSGALNQRWTMPTGTAKAYLFLLGESLGLFISFGWVNCVALFQAEHEETRLKNYSISDVAWIISTESFLMLFLSPVSNYQFDNYGPRLPSVACCRFLI
ncbi:hypothetical protein BJX76DRAFT_354537 [Aspergillus varians]